MTENNLANNLNKASTSHKAIEIVKVSKRYKGNDRFAVKDLSFDVLDGQFHVLVGHNGAGKTTIIKSIIGAYHNFEGIINIFGQNSTHAESRSGIAYIPEKTIFPNHLNVLEYLAAMIYFSRDKVSLKNSKIEAEKALKAYRMEQFATKNPNELSSGQKKKIFLIQALVNNPRLIVLDEPTANLDPIAREEFWKLLESLNDKGTTLLVATHVIAEIEHLKTSATIIEEGVVKYSGVVDKGGIMKLYRKHVSKSKGTFSA